ADEDRESDGAQSQPPGNIGYFYARQILPVKINGGAPSQRQPDQPAERDAKNPAEKSHGAGFRKEKTAHVAVSCAKRLQDTDLAAAFEDGHHQSVDDAQ